MDGKPGSDGSASGKLSNKYAGQPALLLSVAAAVTCRYTKAGCVGGEATLKLPPLHEKVVEVRRVVGRASLAGAAKPA